MSQLKRYIILIVVLPVLALMNHSCFEGLNDFTYDGSTVVEFSHLSYIPDGADWVSVGSYWSATITGNVDDAPLQVSLVGPQRTEPVEIGYYIADQVYRDKEENKLKLEQPAHDEWELYETTAVAGTDYNILDGGIIIIPAKSSFGLLSIELTPTAERTLYIVLEAGDVAPSENYKIFRLNIEP
ncbi:MAG: hypothetical protein U9N72_00600 [Bacteroidota bacterium]|nr:hypothetical protein [Bacteroidota bacterium]